MNNETNSNQKFTIFVGGLNFQTSDSNLREFFLSSPQITGIENVRICRRIEGTSKGFGYVTFNNKSSYYQSLTLNGSLLEGKNIRIEPDNGKKMILSDKKVKNKSSNSYSSSSSPVLKEKSNLRPNSSNSSSYSSSYSYSSPSSSYSSYSSESDKKEKKHQKNHRKSKKRKQRDYSDYSYSS